VNASRPSVIRTPEDTPGPEQGNAIRFGEKCKAQLRREEIGDADRAGEPDRTNPGQRRFGVSSVVNFLG
jgi:hypothetical protein